MEQLSRNEKIARVRKSNKEYKIYKSNRVIQKKSSKKTSIPKISMIHNNSSFQLRLVAASFLFLAFLGMKEADFTYQNMNYNTVLAVISNNSIMESAEEKIISVFNRLD